MSKTLDLVPDYSFISRLTECNRRFYYEYELGLTSPDIFPPIKAGQAFHDGLEVWNKTGDIELGSRALRDSWGDHKVRHEKYDYLSADHLVPILRRFCKAHSDTPRTTVKTGSEIFGERVFTINWNGTEVGGKIDLVEETEDGQVVGVDYKTSSSWINSHFATRRQFGLGHQGRIYTAAIERELDIKLAGFYFHGIYVGEHANEEDRDWSKQQSNPWQLFGPYTWNDRELEETRAWLEQGVRDIAYRREQESEWDRAEYAWPQDVAWHCGNCPFKELCEANPVVRDGLIEHRYVERELTGRLASGADSDD